jgi:hypothetical protein
VLAAFEPPRGRVETLAVSSKDRGGRGLRAMIRQTGLGWGDERLGTADRPVEREVGKRCVGGVQTT